MSEKFDRHLWMISFLWGNRNWARSDEYSEHTITVITDIHPMEYILKAQEIMDEGKVVGNFSLIMDIPAGTITNDQVKLWKESKKWTYRVHFREDIENRNKLNENTW